MMEPITCLMIINSSLTSSFQKYNYASERMGPGPHKAEDVLKVMEALTGAVLKDRVKDKIGPFGFNKGGKKE